MGDRGRAGRSGKRSTASKRQRSHTVCSAHPSGPSTRTCSAVSSPPRVRWTASQSSAKAAQSGTSRPSSPDEG